MNLKKKWMTEKDIIVLTWLDCVGPNVYQSPIYTNNVEITASDRARPR